MMKTRMRIVIMSINRSITTSTATEEMISLGRLTAT
jgi:hypothetical protein